VAQGVDDFGAGCLAEKLGYLRQPLVQSLVGVSQVFDVGLALAGESQL
jgi:hypothetical protein